MRRNALRDGARLFNQGRYIEAYKAFTRAIRQNAAGELAYLKRGLLQAELDNLEDACEDFLAVIRLAPHSAAASFGRGFLAAERDGDTQRAWHYYAEAVWIDPHFAPAYLYRGRLAQELGEQQLAADDFERCLAADPEYALAYPSVAALQSGAPAPALDNPEYRPEPSAPDGPGTKTGVWLRVSEARPVQNSSRRAGSLFTR